MELDSTALNRITSKSSQLQVLTLKKLQTLTDLARHNLTHMICKTIRHNPPLRELNLYDCALSSKEAQAVLDALANSKIVLLQTLDLSENP